MYNLQNQKILEYLKEHPYSSSTQIHKGSALDIGYSTLRRTLSTLVESGLVVTKGQQKSTRYSLSPAQNLFRTFDMEAYFEKEVDERQILDRFNLELISKVLKGVSLFTREEEDRLILLQNRFRNNIAHLSPNQYHKELERLAIDLSWKSSQIEGNTYSLLETEQLIKEKQTASGKPLEDATMLLNHKEAIDYILGHKDYRS